ncbi:MAG: Asp-tRNA(Asn)/Glu-tRNA(Gln) amidotransferase subunit GatA, partial [Terracidiphilus sp.]
MPSEAKAAETKIEALVQKPRTLAALREEVAAGTTKAADLAAGYYERIAEINPRLNIYLSLTKDRAFAQAARIDAMAVKGDPLPPLAGVPVGIKDVLTMRGAPATAGSKILEGYEPPYDATAVARLEAAGAVLLGKLNCDEFAMGSSNENSAYGPVRNPVDPERVPGGSSGGSAAAVAADLAVATLGTDTGGSIRQPASFCGVAGVLPTYGRVSRYGLIAFASSLDRIGPFAANVRDAAALLGVISGHDPHDATSSPAPVPDYAAESDKPAAGLRIGVPAEYFAEGLDAEVRAAVESGIDALRAAGCAVKAISLPHTKYAVPAYYLIATAEASANLARFDGVRYGYRSPAPETLAAMYSNSRDQGFGAEVKRRILLGTYALSAGYYDAYYLKAQQVRRLLAEEFLRAFAEVDAIVTPTSPMPAFKLGEKTG